MLSPCLRPPGRRSPRRPRSPHSETGRTETDRLEQVCCTLTRIILSDDAGGGNNETPKRRLQAIAGGRGYDVPGLSSGMISQRSGCGWVDCPRAALRVAAH